MKSLLTYYKNNKCYIWYNLTHSGIGYLFQNHLYLLNAFLLKNCCMRRFLFGCVHDRFAHIITVKLSFTSPCSVCKETVPIFLISFFFLSRHFSADNLPYFTRLPLSTHTCITSARWAYQGMNMVHGTECILQLPQK